MHKPRRRRDRPPPRLSRLAVADAIVAARDAAREAARVKPRRNEDILDVLVGREVITSGQARAAERWHRDWCTAGSEPNIVALYGPRASPGSGEPGLRAIAARERFEAASLALGGVGFAVVAHIALTPRTALGDFQDSRLWSSARRQQLADTLRAGLERLRRHYAG